MTDVDPAAAAKQARELLERYVGLQPHEASQPQRVALQRRRGRASAGDRARALGNLQQEDGNFQCNVSVRHSRPSKLRRVYASWSTRPATIPTCRWSARPRDNFISKLRISVTPISARPAMRPRASNPSTWRSCMTWSRGHGSRRMAPVTGRTIGQPGARPLALVLSQCLRAKTSSNPRRS
jgi:hypothetical protein